MVLQRKYDLTGKIFGKLTVIKDSGERSKSRSRIWLCECNCGNETKVVASSLIDGKTKSCGCIQKEQATKTHLKDLTGKKFNRLSVIARLTSVNKRTMYLCECDCGNRIPVRSDSIKSGHAQSCGCWNIETLKSNVGENSPSYDARITDEQRVKGRFLYRKELDEWRSSVFERDNFTCQKCKARGVHLHAHHLNGYHWDVENRFNSDNGITLCIDCHRSFHRKYGTRNNTNQQYSEFAEHA